MPELIMSNDLLLSILAVTESAAIATTPFVGGGDKYAVDAAAVAAMRSAFESVPIGGVIVVGEGEKDEAPMLFTGDLVGTGDEPLVDIAVDPIDGTRLAAQQLPGSIAVMSIAPRGSLFDPGPVFYLEKLISSGDTHSLTLDVPLTETLLTMAAQLDRPVDSLRVAIQERARNQVYADAVRAVGAHVVTFRDGDVVTALRAAQHGSSIDLQVGIGGAPEGVLTAVAVRALGGQMEGRLAPQTAEESQLAAERGFDLNRVLRLSDLAAADGYFFLTAVTEVSGITSGIDLREVRIHSDNVHGTRSHTESVVISPGGAIRFVSRQRAV
ncbi:fructose-bisphosphatase class II family protein [Leifsonia sp. A12D58]|uniref:fructose-bisphosphatase class II family protein n=1 Tax=Leifsonia sp. A12D58 TaxID=3397674 RepID=UPI0039E1C332